MKITLIAAGRLRNGPLKELADDFLRRITLPLTINEIDIRPRKTGDAARELEDRFLAALPAKAHTLLLDETGKTHSSRQFADRLRNLRDGAETDHLALVIGGPDGHGPRLREKAAGAIAFGQMTWPHLLARIMLLEQLYRAQSIWAGSPYHRE